MIDKFKLLTLNTKITDKLTISIAELKDYIPFAVKRIYFLRDIKQATGAHCHMIEEEFFIMVQGVVTAVIDQGSGLEDVALHQGQGIYVGNYIWHGFKDPSRDAIILALSSTNYTADRSDYLENYDEYLKIRKEKLAA